jgi:hypothetical protein
VAKSNQIPTIFITLQPSILLLGFVGAISIAAGGVVAYLPIFIGYKIAIVALIVASSYYFIWRDILLKQPQSWQSLRVDNKGELQLSNKNGQQFKPQLAENTFFHANIIILNFKNQGLINILNQKNLPPCIIVKTMQNAEEFRKLSVWLRWFKRDKTAQDALSLDDAA